MKYNVTQYACDICGKSTTIEPEILHWFNLPKIQNGYACLECGHLLHKIFDLMGIEHKFICKQYSIEKREIGLIEV